MKKKKLQGIEDFDAAFDSGEISVDFHGGILTEGMSRLVKLPPLSIPTWLALEIETISKVQANSKSSVIRQLLVEAIDAKRKLAS
jgi:hypothetical protein